jgi:hypothetical protein
MGGTYAPRERTLTRDAHAMAAPEFGLVAATLSPLLLGIIVLGLTMRTGGTLQATAAEPAHCAAISSLFCTGSNEAAQQAVTHANEWIGPNALSKDEITVKSGASNCNGLASAPTVVNVASGVVGERTALPRLGQQPNTVCLPPQ